MAEMERQVRAIEMDGLLWGASRLLPVGYGIKKLQITTVVEDDKVSVDDLEERIVAIEDYVSNHHLHECSGVQQDCYRIAHFLFLGSEYGHRCV